MPLAFDLTWTLASGSILPVATTDFAMSPFSTVASFEASIERFGRVAATPVAARTTTRALPPSRIKRRLDLGRLLMAPSWIPDISRTLASLPRVLVFSQGLRGGQLDGRNIPH